MGAANQQKARTVAKRILPSGPLFYSQVVGYIITILPGCLLYIYYIARWSIVYTLYCQVFNYVYTLYCQVVHYNEKTVVRLQLWDIAGQERFGNMTRVYYRSGSHNRGEFLDLLIYILFRDAAAAFVVFDLTRIATFEAAAKWKDDLDMKVCVFFLTNPETSTGETAPMPDRPRRW